MNTTNQKINWSQKLTSRKFWAAVVGFVTPLIIAFGYSEATATEVAAIIMAGASVIAYIVGEGLVDSSRISSENSNSDKVEEE